MLVGVKLTLRGTVSNSVEPSLVSTTMSLSPRVMVEIGTYSAIFFSVASRWSSASVTSRPERVPDMTALFAFSRSASRLFSSPTAVEISWSATERKDWIALVPSFSVRTTSRAASSVVSARLRFDGAAE